MSNENQLVSVNQVLELDRRVDKEDVAAILMARAEATIKNHIKACESLEKKLKLEQAEHNKELYELLQECANTASEKTLKLLTDAAAELGCKGIVTNVSTEGLCSTKNTFTAAIHVRASKPNISWSVQSDIKANAAIKVNAKTGKDLQQQLHNNNVTWIDWRRKLQDLPSLERRAKAAVAADRLRDSVEGQRLLEVLEGQLLDGIQLLGVN